MYSLIWAMGSTVSSDAAATGTATGTAGMSSTLIMLVAMVAIFYFLLIRPQRKRDKEAKEMMASLKKGDKIVTIGGIRGTVSAVKETTVVVKVDSETRIEFNKSAISQVLNAAPAAKSESKAKEEEVVEAPKKSKKKAVEAPQTEEPAEAPAEEPKAEEPKAEE
jgi:preprotein translocase subunit YajC